VRSLGKLRPSYRRAGELTPLWISLVAAVGVMALAHLLRQEPAPTDRVFYGQMEFANGLLALIFAAAALARFRGTFDRQSLIFAGGFAINGAVLVSLTFAFSHAAFRDSGLPLRDPTTWVISRTLLALLFLVPLFVERSPMVMRRPNREMAVVLLFVIVLTALLSSIHYVLPIELVVYPDRLISRPGNLIPGALFLVAAVVYWRRLTHENRIFDLSIVVATALNFLCCVAASESVNVLDAPFILAAVLQFCGYVALLGGALFDSVRLFDKIRHMAATDPLTGLANYRGLMESLEAERVRSERTGRVFSVALLDLDRLKTINDRYGHLVGSRAICRVAAVLRRESRAIDVAARYGGDEFALVLPETTTAAAGDVVRRICWQVSQDLEEPRLSVSAGIAGFPQNGKTVEALLLSADHALYQSKGNTDVAARAAAATAQRA
jgi:diguanylate cyclase (GGDEF)-like protein